MLIIDIGKHFSPGAELSNVSHGMHMEFLLRLVLAMKVDALLLFSGTLNFDQSSV